MTARESRSVFRYFQPADAFVRILVRDARAPGVRPIPGLDGRGYRSQVVESCCPEYRGGLEGRLMNLPGCDPGAALDLLYHLCIEVNPELDIHTVRLRPVVTESEGTKAAPEGAPAERSQALKRLRARSRDLDARLRDRLVGQPEALTAVARLVRRAAADLAEPGRPLGSLMLVGRTGTGKTELARLLARDLFGEHGLVRVDCAEFGAAHEYAKLIGAPPGYVGHEHGGVLTDALRKNPDCVVLFDEVEKAHSRLHQLLLSILDDGRLTDAQGRTVNFDRALLVLTSNVGSCEVQGASRRLGFASDEDGLVGDGALREIVQGALESQFPPEFLGRLSETVLFRELDLSDARRIAERLLCELAVRVRRSGARVVFSPSVARWVAAHGFRPDAGARELRHVIAREIEAPLAEHLLASPRKRPSLRISIRADRPRFARAA